jgi:AraC-like DNA-binding protein
MYSAGYVRASTEEQRIETAPAHTEAPQTPVMLDVCDLVATIACGLEPVAGASPAAGVRLALPDRLPLIRADSTGLAQALHYLLACAQQCAAHGTIEVRATVVLPFLRLTLAGLDASTGALLAQVLEQAEPAAVPASLDPATAHALCAGRRLVQRQDGVLTPALGTQREACLHVDLPLTTLAEQRAAPPAADGQVILLVAGKDATRQTLEKLVHPRPVQIASTPVSALESTVPAALAWDASCADAGEWELLVILRRHAAFSSLPFLLLAPQPVGGAHFGATTAEAIAALCPDTAGKLVHVIAADAAQQRAYQRLVERDLPGIPVHTEATLHHAAGAAISEGSAFVLLELATGDEKAMDALSGGENTCHVPMLALTGQRIDEELLRRCRRFTALTLCGTGILTGDEITALIKRVLVQQTLPQPHIGDLVRQTVAYLHQHYADSISRAELAAAVGVSENYLSQIFRQEIGISLWEYLSRFRISRAQELLRQTVQSITAVAAAVGIPDPAYFSRIFHRQVGMSPSAYRVAGRRNIVP